MSETNRILGGLVVVAFGLMLIYMIQGRMGCQTARQQNREERREKRSKREKVCQLLRIDDGATLTVVWGLRDRGEKTVVIEGISIPSTQQSAAKANLEKLTAGNQVRVHYEVHRLFAAEAGEEELEDAELESSSPIVGAVYGDGGLNLGIEQLRAGLAKCQPDAAKELINAEREAKKAKKGIWGT
jgi:endonuclease YncB( thermonuclease family)